MPERALAAAPTKEQVLETLRVQAGNVSRPARALGWHRTQLRRWLEKHEVDVTTIAGVSVDD